MNETHPADRQSDLMLIREFSTRSRLSSKALRLYDALGLLEPAFVDPQSNYRYYSADQLERAKLISVLRQLEMPLQRIADFLELAGEAAARALEAYWREVEALHRDKRSLVQYLEQRFEKKEIPMFNIETRHVPAEKIATISRRMFQPEVGQFIPSSIARLREYIAAQGVEAKPIDWVIYDGQLTADSDALVEVCVPFTGTLEPTDEIAVKFEPAHEEAFIRLEKWQCFTPDIMHAYDAVAKWMTQNEHQLILGCREVYWSDWVNTPDDQPAFDVAYPF
jgi:DNA-binding transcriptional MerR regulator